MGHARGSSEALVGTTEGVVRAWTIRRLPEAERWDAESITEMQGTPAQPNPTAPGLHIPIAINIDQGGNISGPQWKQHNDRKNRKLVGSI